MACGGRKLQGVSSALTLNGLMFISRDLHDCSAKALAHRYDDSRLRYMPIRAALTILGMYYVVQHSPNHLLGGESSSGEEQDNGPSRNLSHSWIHAFIA